MLTFDTYTAVAPQDSGRWATSDRGWMHDAEGACIGFYLSYDQDPVRPTPFVLAVIYDRPRHAVTGAALEPQRHLSTTQATVEEAVAWMQLNHEARGTQ